MVVVSRQWQLRVRIFQRCLGESTSWGKTARKCTPRMVRTRSMLQTAWGRIRDRTWTRRFGTHPQMQGRNILFYLREMLVVELEGRRKWWREKRARLHF